MFLWNLLLALAWAAMSGTFSLGNVAFGFALGFGVLGLARRDAEARRYFRRTGQLLLLVLYFVKELLVANLRMARDVMLPRSRMRPGIISVPLKAQTDAEITCVANLITLTPGTLSLDVSADRRTLYVHAMEAADVEAVRRGITGGLERRVLEVLR